MQYTRTCPICGVEFVTTNAMKKYCSDDCYVMSKRKHREVVTRRSENGKYQKRKCHDCGRPTYNYRCEECWRKLRDTVGW